MRVLVTGANGQLGREVVEAFAGHDVVATDRPTLDVGSSDSVLAAITTVEPDAVVHAAAWTDVDGCEADPDRALRVNALGTRHVVSAARLVGARVCYISTDYVFDGRTGRPYDEWDTPQPVSVYGRSKHGGELELGPEDTTVRTSWLCGRHGTNFVRTVLTRAAAGQELRVVDDQHGCLTHAGDLAAMIRRLVGERRPGVFHVTNQGATTWFRLARDAVAEAGLDVDLVHPIRTCELHPPRPAARPPYAVLDNAALRLSGLPLLPEHHDALARLVLDLAPAAVAR
ncbi:MAG TPA: dTDP-4-dehydrorhamnose reductase [Acidimicrobiales bacterium]|nr:dTDP-4-dehydrorhamnose reductase [Acidimicrobiales bacterium]